jgi:uncharacterized membrane-anchored protein
MKEIPGNTWQTLLDAGLVSGSPQATKLESPWYVRLMQGDYMALNYRMANEIMQALPRKENPDRPWQPEYKAHGARVVATLNDLFIAQLNRLDDGTALQENEIYLDYRVRGGKLKFASNAFFFQEGTAEQYETAHYGRFKVAADGELLLVALHDEQLKQLGIETR